MKKRLFCTLQLLFIMMLFFVMSCDGGGAGSDTEEEASYDISAVSVKSVVVDDSVLIAGHSGKISVVLESSAPVDVLDVPVSVTFMQGESDDTQQYYSGTYLVETVSPGEHEYELNIAIPQIDASFGSFSVLVFLYDKLIESLGDDVNLSDESSVDLDIALDEDGIGAEATVELDPVLQRDPDLVISSPAIPSNIIVVTGRAGEFKRVNFRFAANVLAQTMNDAKVTFHVSHMDGSFSSQLQIVNGDGVLVNEMTLPQLAAYADPLTQTYTLHLPYTFIQPIVEYAKTHDEESYPYVITARVESASEPYSFTYNNEVLGRIVIVPDNSLLPEVTDEYSDGYDYDVEFGGKWFAAGISMSSDTGADKNKIYFKNQFSIPAKVFGFKFDLYRVDFNVKSFYGEDDASVSFTSKSFAATLYNMAMDGAGFIDSGGLKNPSSLVDNFNFDSPSLDLGSVFSSIPTFAGEDDCHFGSGPHLTVGKEYNGDYLIGPVPVSFTIGAIGGVGVGTVLSLTDGLGLGKLEAGFVPYCFAKGYLEAGVGPSWIRVAGVGGVLHILDMQFKNMISYEWKDEMNSENKWFRTITLNNYAGLSINLIKGQVYVFVRYPWPKFKKKWGIPYFAGFQIKELKHFLVDTNYLATIKNTFMKTSEEIILIPKF